MQGLLRIAEWECVRFGRRGCWFALSPQGYYLSGHLLVVVQGWHKYEILTVFDSQVNGHPEMIPGGRISMGKKAPQMSPSITRPLPSRQWRSARDLTLIPGAPLDVQCPRKSLPNLLLLTILSVNLRHNCNQSAMFVSL